MNSKNLHLEGYFKYLTVLISILSLWAELYRSLDTMELERLTTAR